jgi:hypothetical protein
VNDSAGDTCFWKNTRPDWGEPDCNNDDPYFSGDIYADMSSSGYSYCNPPYQENESFYQDIIKANQLRDGTYSVLVHYYKGTGNNEEAVPQLNIELGKRIDLPALVNFIKISPGRPLKLGEIWYAGKIQLPEMTFSTLDQRIFPWPGVLMKPRKQ